MRLGLLYVGLGACDTVADLALVCEDEPGISDILSQLVMSQIKGIIVACFVSSLPVQHGESVIELLVELVQILHVVVLLGLALTGAHSLQVGLFFLSIEVPLIFLLEGRWNLVHSVNGLGDGSGPCAQQVSLTHASFGWNATAGDYRSLVCLSILLCDMLESLLELGLHGSWQAGGQI